MSSWIYKDAHMTFIWYDLYDHSLSSLMVVKKNSYHDITLWEFKMLVCFICHPLRNTAEMQQSMGLV